MIPDFAIDPRHDPTALAMAFAKSGRIRISHFLTSDSARALHDELATSMAWRRLINGGDRVFEISRADFAALDPIHRKQIDNALSTASLNSFQFNYEAIRISDDPVERSKSATVFDVFLDFMNSLDVRQCLGEITGASPIDLIDGQATAYGTGDFLTRHDDDVVSKNRSAAYVLGLTKGWQPDWGGMLQFHAGWPDAWVPEFNTLSLFKVPQHHSVSRVMPAADRLRLSMTGWLRNHS